MRMNSFLVALITLLAASFGFITPTVQGQGFTGVFTQHNDTARTGQNLNETILTPANIAYSEFGKIFSYPVDGQVYAQPLYVPNVTIPGQGVHNVLYVATENDSLYAFDADGLTPNILWYLSFINPANGITTINCIATGIVCNIYPITGITSTPVIDPTSNTIYLVVRTQENNNSVQRLHALDITTGDEKFGGPVEISATVSGTGTGTSHGKVMFNALHDIQRAGLLLANGNVYIGWAGQAHGWLMAYNATTLAQVAVMNTTPNGTLGGVWQAGNGPALDSLGNIYIATGDGTFDANTGGVDYSDTLLKLDADLKVLDYFTPMDQACRLLPNDLDLGSGGPLIFPSQTGSYPDEIIQAGKGGSPCDLFGTTYAVPIYLVNRDDMGTYHPQGDQDIETIEGTVHGYWSSPAYWQSPTAQYVYYSGQTNETGNGDYLKQYSITNGLVSTAPVEQTPNLFTVGSTPSISANGTSDGILWAVERKDILSASPGTHPAVLYAYNATDVATELYNSGQAKGLRDQPGCANKFITPTVANGKVYVGTQNELDVYGILPNPQTTPVATISAPCITFAGQTVGKTSPPVTTTLSNLGPGNLIINGIALTGYNPTEFKETNTCGSSLAPAASCTISITFTASVQKVPQIVDIAISDNAAGGGQNIFVIGVALKPAP
ncbi:MAG: choice-of-anchor D domain-containing protein [Candidatus Sulfotelmatobacter sp.]